MAIQTGQSPTAVGNIGKAPNVPQAAADPQPGGLYFPERLQTQPYWMSFSFYEYQMPDVVNIFGGNNNQKVYYNDKGTIRLPLPNNMTDGHHVEYQAESLSLAQAAGAQIAKQGGVGNMLTGLATQGVVSGLGNFVTNAIGKPNLNPVLQSQGVILNPFLTVMFKSPAFKEHNFAWKLTPSNQHESMMVNQIINTFRMNMLPDQSGALGGTLLTYPNIVQINVSVNDATFFTYPFKPAVIKNFEVNFTGGGQPSFFGRTNAPTEVEIRMNVMEIEYWLSSDYGLDSFRATDWTAQAENGARRVGETVIDALTPNPGRGDRGINSPEATGVGGPTG